MNGLWTCQILVLLSSLGAQALHQGLYSHQISDGQLVVPRKVNHLGEHISHDLTHHWRDEDEDDSLFGLANNSKRRRRRRSTSEANAGLHYQLEMNNETLHIELEPSHDSFIAPLMVIERHRRDTRSRKYYQHDVDGAPRRKPNNTICHYQGKIRNHANSKVALSACNGLAGYMATKDGFYWVEPSKKHRYHPELGHPHVIFQGQGPNGSGAAANSATKLPKKYQKHRKHQNHHQMRRKRRLSTCGTKEPKQSSETRIEWQKQGKVIVQGGRKAKGRRVGRHQDHRQKKMLREEQRRKKRRPRRSISTPHHVEALLVADNSMAQFHQEVDTYLLTIMNMVSSLYKDPTIGNLVQVTVVRIVVLDDEEGEDYEELEITHQAESTLSNFCRWQRNLNPKSESDPSHHDVAILITRKDICSGSGCQTLGVANVGGMCRPDRSCSVNEDNGITLAHTITHELGHNFGMYHDTEKTGCGHRIGPILHVMTPSFESDTTHVSWSNCSRRDITHFLDQGLGSCLDDEPTAEPIPFIYGNMPAGAMYKAVDQCRFQFNTTDEHVKVCSRVDEICSQLWCQIDDNCVTQLKPAAAGTGCGYHKWCHEKQCIEINDLPKAVHGGWGNWSDWSECSRTCGAGISLQKRVCDNPPPANGGSFCIGKRTRYKTCNTEACPVDEPSFRAVQCSGFNDQLFRGKNYTWLPYFDTQEPCKLFCTDTDDTVIVPWGPHAIDGTPCNIGTNDMCVNGQCKTVGCDWIVDSNTTEDQCGVCGGSGDTCEVVKGEFTKKLNISEGYYPVVTIPAGSRNIHVEEVGPSKNFLSIGKANSKTFYLNGERIIYLSGEYNIAGTLGLYERNLDKDKETLKIPGPILEDIILYVLMKGKHKNVGLTFEYTLSSNSTIEPVYAWKLGDWTACSATCGGGVQHRFPICYQEYKGIVDEDMCWANAQNERPTELKRACNELDCPYLWYTGPWQMCAITCKKRGHPEPMKRRSVLCVDQDSNAVPDTNCAELERPDNTESCGQVFPYCESEEVTDVDKKVLQNKL